MVLDKTLSKEEQAKRLCEELERLRQERAGYEKTWKNAQALVSNVQLSFEAAEGDASKGFDKPRRITDRPAQYGETLVAGLCGYGVNPGIKWMKLGLSDEKAMKRHGVKDWLEAVEVAECEEFDNSNFYTEMKIVIDQATLFGFGVMGVEEDRLTNQVRFRQINVPEVYLDTNEHNEYETVFRRYFVTIENLVSQFGKDKMSHPVRSAWENQDSAAARAKEVEILHAVFRRKNRDGKSELNAEMPFASYIVDIANKHIIEESGYRTFPYAIFVWERVGGKKYPISPAIKSLNDADLLQKTESARLDMAQMSGKPPFTLPDSMKGASDIFGEDGYIAPGAIIPYNDLEARVPPQAINMGASYPVAIDVTKAQADAVKDWFYVDFFLMLQQQNIARMTATAVQALQGEKAATMTNMIVNLKKALQTVVQRTYDLMARMGRLPDLPDALLRPAGEKGHQMRFNFSSVLSQVQSALLRYQGTQQLLPVAQAIASLGQAHPAAAQSLDYIDFDILLTNEARAAHVPETAIREDDDVQAIREARARQQQQQQMAAQQQAAQESLMRNYDKLGQPPAPGSPAAALFGGQG